jgi:6-phosphogluconolactonase
MVKFLEKGLPGVETEWSKWRLFFCDERIVPVDSADSTFGAYRNALIGKIPLTEDQFITVDSDLSGKFSSTFWSNVCICFKVIYILLID